MQTPQANTAPTETDIMLVRQTFDLVVPIAGVAADLFYDRLFYIAPSLRGMFSRSFWRQGHRTTSGSRARLPSQSLVQVKLPWLSCKRLGVDPGAGGLDVC